jgi:hypothetical protein
VAYLNILPFCTHFGCRKLQLGFLLATRRSAVKEEMNLYKHVDLPLQFGLLAQLQQSNSSLVNFVRAVCNTQSSNASERFRQKEVITHSCGAKGLNSTINDFLSK